MQEKCLLVVYSGVGTCLMSIAGESTLIVNDNTDSFRLDSGINVAMLINQMQYWQQVPDGICLINDSSEPTIDHDKKYIFGKLIDIFTITTELIEKKSSSSPAQAQGCIASKDVPYPTLTAIRGAMLLLRDTYGINYSLDTYLLGPVFRIKEKDNRCHDKSLLDIANLAISQNTPLAIVNGKMSIARDGSGTRILAAPRGNKIINKFEESERINFIDVANLIASDTDRKEFIAHFVDSFDLIPLRFPGLGLINDSQDLDQLLKYCQGHYAYIDGVVYHFQD